MQQDPPNKMNSQVILVDKHDTAIGVMDKMEAHQKGILHRAYSVFVFNKNKELLLQRRALTKYHSGGLWTNTCCSHPQPKEEVVDSAIQCLLDEMGFTCPLTFAFKFQYRSKFSNGLVENELDYVFIGNSNDEPFPNTDEVSDWRYQILETIDDEITQAPEKFTSWFKICMPMIRNYLDEQ